MEKLNNGADCSPTTLKSFTTLIDPTKAEHEACKSNRCYCGKCADQLTSKLPIDSKCSENSDCSSGYCMGWVTGMCSGRCKPKAKIGEDCSPAAAKDMLGYSPTSAADDFCESGRCLCGRCAAHDSLFYPNQGEGGHAGGMPCATNDNCVSTGCGGGVDLWLFEVTADCNGQCSNRWSQMTCVQLLCI